MQLAALIPYPYFHACTRCCFFSRYDGDRLYSAVSCPSSHRRGKKRRKNPSFSFPFIHSDCDKRPSCPEAGQKRIFPPLIFDGPTNDICQGWPSVVLSTAQRRCEEDFFSSGYIMPQTVSCVSIAHRKQGKSTRSRANAKHHILR